MNNNNGRQANWYNQRIRDQFGNELEIERAKAIKELQDITSELTLIVPTLNHDVDAADAALEKVRAEAQAKIDRATKTANEARYVRSQKVYPLERRRDQLENLLNNDLLPEVIHEAVETVTAVYDDNRTSTTALDYEDATNRDKLFRWCVDAHAQLNALKTAAGNVQEQVERILASRP